MHTRKSRWLAVSLLAGVGLAACVDREERAGHEAPAPASTPPVAARDVSASPDAASAPTPAPKPEPAPGAIGFTGLAQAAWGASEEQVRMAWGRDMQAEPVDDPAACHYLFPLPRPPAGFGTAFMFENGKLVRIDVDSVHVAAPGGGKVGMTADAVRALYPGRIEVRPHKYVEGGQYLRVVDPGSAGVLVFNAGGDTVDSWRVGIAPPVDYVEGCG